MNLFYRWAVKSLICGLKKPRQLVSIAWHSIQSPRSSYQSAPRVITLLQRFISVYRILVLQKPLLILLLVALTVAFFAYHTQGFRLDASSDSLVLENDKSLDYYRAIRARYGSDDFLFLTYTPEQDLFSESVLADLQALRDQLQSMPRVKSVISLLDVPLIQSPPVTLNELRRHIPTLEQEQTDKALARQEFLASPLYQNLIISPDGRTTAMQVIFQRDEAWHQLLNQRNQLREKRLLGELSAAEKVELETVSKQFDAYNTRLQKRVSRDIAQVREIMQPYRQRAELHLGGVPMIASDSIDFIRADLMSFGLGVLAFLVLLLAVAFKKPRWVVLPMLTCFASGVITVGFLGLVDWPVTVVSSNFISLLLIITLSLTVHLIVRYRELHELNPQADQAFLVWQTLRSKFEPSFYTAITTQVAFASLIFSDIRPVIDFGWMMNIGITVAFVLVFTLFPATVMLLKPPPVANSNDLTDRITGYFARMIEAFDKRILGAYALLAILAAAGVSQLSVENRFIDYFKDDTEIYRGMELIDNQLGGTTPLDVVIDASSEFLRDEAEWRASPDYEADTAGITSSSYWFNTFQLKQVFAVHDYLESLPETGKVLSVATTMEMLSQIDKDFVTDDFLLSVLYRKLPDEIKQSLLRPYMAEDGNQLRFSIRVFESDPSLQREALLQKIRTDLTNDLELEPQQVQLTGMLVLYNNMLQSLFSSQIKTLGVVFLAILIMFAILFRNLRMALVAIIPNLFSAGLVLGVMGGLGISLDLMTITIAAITIGIAVDDTIHYVHRITDEFPHDRNYWAAVKRSHASIGRAMYYTTITITLGFSILALSNFVPTIYFGLLTGFAMVAALLANLTLLPQLIVRFKPLGQ